MINMYRFVPVTVGVLLLITLLPARPTAAQPMVAARFRDYYQKHDGMRVLGPPVSALIVVDGYPMQYFEKGRIEDHRADVRDSQWAFMYGRLTAELIEQATGRGVNGTSMTYADLAAAAAPPRRVPVPAGFDGGVVAVQGGFFVPYDPQLRSAPGYIVPSYFWSYMNRLELFPGGWLHDIGLPLTNVILTEAIKNGERRQIAMQAFERTVLTFDQQNPLAWQVERGNVGVDAVAIQSRAGSIEIPASGAITTLPLHIQARVGRPGEQVTALVRWEDGVKIQQSFRTLQGKDGGGLLITTLGWQTEGLPPRPSVRKAVLELRGEQGTVLAQQPIEILRPEDPNTQTVMLYWLHGERLQRQARMVPETTRIGTAALEALVWGPLPGNLPGYKTALPSAAEVLSYPGRTPEWGPRVTLRGLTIMEGVATADFSREMRAYGGDIGRGRLIGKQIARTLMQFPSVQDVRITIEGQIDDALQPNTTVLMAPDHACAVANVNCGENVD